jgi:hypothetical protein
MIPADHLSGALSLLRSLPLKYTALSAHSPRTMDQSTNLRARFEFADIAKAAVELVHEILCTDLPHVHWSGFSLNQICRSEAQAFLV